MALVSQWTLLKNEFPPEQLVVETISPNGLQQQLKRLGNRWYHVNGTTYVYYTPLFWKHVVP